jgi:uncharacterized protein (TIGR02646 family)
MIPVTPQPEPVGFDVQVRQKGLKFLQTHDITTTVPSGKTLPSHWRACLDDLYASYQGQCAYLAVFFERVTGGGTVDHFIAKSHRPDLAYEWSNYRLACSHMNSRKRDYKDVLDPFEIMEGWFRLEMVTGQIYPSPELDPERRDAVKATIDRLGLDAPGNRDMRSRHYLEYLEGTYTAKFLHQRSPFVWYEAQRQGLL